VSTADIRNFVLVSDRVGTAGQPTAQQLADARDEGYRVVVNLAPDDAPGALPDESRTVRDLGLAYHHLPVPWDDPRPEHFVAFTRVMDGIGDEKVLVHCAANYRVTAFYSRYAMKRSGWTEEQADALMARVWDPDVATDVAAVWCAFIRAVRDL
jgi:protein tyrosine phosphatase (PTP) superfamily phosphohydrolase (DUF442 family)